MQDWNSFGWLKPHVTSEMELSNLLTIVDRDLADSETSGLSSDWKFGIAYNATLKLCTMLLYDAGFMPEKSLAHFRTLQSLQFTLGVERRADAEYLDACRIKRNHIEYDYVEGASESEAKELIDFAKQLRSEVLQMLQAKYPNLGIDHSDATRSREM